MRKNFLLLAALSLGFAAAAQSIGPDPAFRTGRLDNGLSYYIAHNENPSGCAEFFIAHNVGALQEEDNQDGLAHFLEHMAFNGTRHFPGDSLLKFLATEGVRFGYNVNAYTTRQETVYNISVVPLVRESFVDSVLLALHDWSCDISCEPQALDDERGVISEEYRLRDDPRSRIARLQSNLIYKGSKQTKRSVIGSLEVINNFKREEILDFYHKWYRPDLQAILIVGDFDVDWMEGKVRKAFADIPPREGAPEKERYFPQKLEQPLFEDIADARLTFHAFKIFYRQPYPAREEQPTEGFLKDMFCRQLVSSALAERLKKACQQKGSPARSAVVSTNAYEPDFYVSLFTVTPKKKEQMGQCLAMTHREIRRLLAFGISADELEAARLSVAQRLHLDREPVREDAKSEDLVRMALQHFLRNHPLVHPADLHEIQMRILAEVTPEDVAPYPGKMFQESEVIYTNCYNPVEEPGIAPSTEEMKAILAAVDAEALEPAFLQYKAPNLHVDAPAGSIRKVSRKNGYELWTLSNGVKVYYKASAAVPSHTHLVMSYRWNSGAASYREDQVTASRVAASYLSRHLGFRGMGKPEFKNCPELSGCFITSSILRTKTAISVLSSKGKEETAFKTVFLTLSEPYFGTQLEKSKENSLKSLSRPKSPRERFDERCQREEYGNHPWMQPVDSAAVLAVDMDLVEDVFHRAFGNYRALSVFICSDLDRGLIEDYVCRYVASLQGDYPYKKSKVSAPRPVVKGSLTISEEHPAKGEPLTHIYHAWLRGEKATPKAIVTSDFLDYILSARYLALIREERGGAYHVGYSTVVPDNNSHPWRGVVRFQTRPELKEQLLQDVTDVMARMCADGPTEQEMEVAAKYILKRHGELDAKAARSLGMQLDRLEDAVLLGRRYDIDYNKLIHSIKASDVQKMARRFAAGDVLEEIYTEQ